MKNRFLSIGGFTLIELMVTLAIAAILVLVAVPNFLQFQRNSELTSITNSFIAAVNSARTEAMKTGMNAIVEAANNGNDWSKGWVVFVDMDRNDTYSSGDILVMEQPALPAHITVAGNNTFSDSPSYLRYGSSGFSKPKLGGLANSTINFSRNDVASTDYSQIRRVIIAITGRVRVCTPKSDTDKTCSSSSTN